MNDGTPLQQIINSKSNGHSNMNGYNGQQPYPGYYHPGMQQQPYKQTPYMQPNNNQQNKTEEDTEIGGLVKDINNGLEDSDDLEEVIETDDKKKKKNNKDNEINMLETEKLLNFVKNFFILLFIYLLFSLETVTDLISNYIIPLRDDKSGKATYTGIIIYGAILSMVHNSVLLLI